MNYYFSAGGMVRPKPSELKEMTQERLHDLFAELTQLEERVGIIDLEGRQQLYAYMTLPPPLTDYFVTGARRFIAKHLANAQSSYFIDYAEARRNWPTMKSQNSLNFLKAHLQKMSICFGFDCAPTIEVRAIGDKAAACYIALINAPIGHIIVNTSAWQNSDFDLMMYYINHEYAHALSHLNGLRVPSQARERLSDIVKQSIPEMSPDDPLFSHYQRNQMNMPGHHPRGFYFSLDNGREPYHRQPEEEQARFFGHLMAGEMKHAVDYIQQCDDQGAFCRALYAEFSKMMKLESASAPANDTNVSQDTELEGSRAHSIRKKALCRGLALLQELHENNMNQPLEPAANLIGTMAFLVLFDEHEGNKDAVDDPKIINLEAVMKIERLYHVLEHWDAKYPDARMTSAAWKVLSDFVKEAYPDNSGKSYLLDQWSNNDGKSALPPYWPHSKAFDHLAIKTVKYTAMNKGTDVLRLAASHDHP